MTMRQLREFCQLQPSAAFKMKLADGRVYTLDHPDVLASPDQRSITFYDSDGPPLCFALNEITALKAINANRSSMLGRFLEFWRRRPFAPFEICLSDGSVVTADDPGFISLSPDSQKLVFATHDRRLVYVAVAEIKFIELLGGPAA